MRRTPRMILSSVKFFPFSNVPSRRRRHSRRPGAKKMGPPKSQSTITGQEDKRFSNGPARALLLPCTCRSCREWIPRRFSRPPFGPRWCSSDWSPSNSLWEKQKKKKLRKQKSISIFTSRAAPPFFFFSQKRKTACAHKINFTARHTHREGGEGKER